MLKYHHQLVILEKILCILSQPLINISVSQRVQVEKGFQYELCAYVKFLNNITQRRLGFTIQSYNKTPGFHESYSSRSYYGVTDWKKICFKVGSIKKSGINSEPYWLGI